MVWERNTYVGPCRQQAVQCQGGNLRFSAGQEPAAKADMRKS